MDNPDMTFPFALTEFASNSGLRGVILAGVLAAVMSAVSALANSTATIFALDVYRRMIRKEADDRAVVRVGRIASMLALCIAAFLCPAVAHLGGIFRYFQTGVTWLATPFISVFLLGILWKRTNYAGAVFGIVGGLVIQLAVAIGTPFLGFRLHWLYTAFIAQVIIMAGVVAVSLATQPPRNEQTEKYVWRPALLGSHALEISRPWYQSVGLWFGLYAVIWFSIY
jgi:SSS family solute:Na+ symporter